MLLPFLSLFIAGDSIPRRNAPDVTPRVIATETRLRQVPGPRPNQLLALGFLDRPADTVKKRRKLVSYSDLYTTRLGIHRVLSYAMVPLFIGSYLTGDKLLEQGPQAPGWARKAHGPLATGTAVLFGLNTVTGLWNLWDARKDPAGRTKRYLHTILFMAASAGFTYAGVTLAEEAENSADARRQHRTVALSSMGVSVVSWSMMLFFK